MAYALGPHSALDLFELPTPVQQTVCTLFLFFAGESNDASDRPPSRVAVYPSRNGLCTRSTANLVLKEANKTTSRSRRRVYSCGGSSALASKPKAESGRGPTVPTRRPGQPEPRPRLGPDRVRGPSHSAHAPRRLVSLSPCQ